MPRFIRQSAPAESAFVPAEQIGDGLPDHLSISAVLTKVAGAIADILPRAIWVKGEVSSYRGPANGHHFFDLVERRHGKRDAILSAVVWEDRWRLCAVKLRTADVEIRNGQEMLLQGTINLYEGAGKLRLHVTDVYPEFTLGQIERQRREVLARLQRESLMDVNKRHTMPDIPVRIGLISSSQAEGMADFVRVLQASGFAFTVFHIDVRVQGLEMETSVCEALRIFAREHSRLRLDVLCIVRGGGSATDLGWWNSYPICAAVAQVPFPVICGIGHERDRVALDEVVHTRTSTPTAAAELIIRSIRAAEMAISDAREAVWDLAKAVLVGERRLLNAQRTALVDLAASRFSAEKTAYSNTAEQAQSEARKVTLAQKSRLAGFRQAISLRVRDGVVHARRDVQDLARNITAGVRSAIASELGVLEQMQQGIVGPGPGLLSRARRVVSDVARAVSQLARGQLQQQGRERGLLIENLTACIRSAVARQDRDLGQLRAIVEAYDPLRILARGYSITRDDTGKAITEATCVRPGSEVITYLAKGQLRSTVSEIAETNSEDTHDHTG
jgi:exodeoxyribonuclease VII large subunit